ncbi:sensor histidine kinase [Hymenobacter elongatus]|uniref:Signal transduction histidine kinase internal region domain-containing protein n=1 Tax=Hymenobacter elongatus TaxID=877208 RepID=A0A4Z0PRC1_9BACT|nr:sensor histidine kinase [Hymenobacter elongatus]TGE19879.1 hypothetical protein E5J99_01920 [Hymenobacter elongatus]
MSCHSAPSRHPRRSDWLTAAGYWVVVTIVLLPDYIANHDLSLGLRGMAYTVLLDSATVYLLVFHLLPALQMPQTRRRALLLLPLFLLLSSVLYSTGYAVAFNETQELSWAALTPARLAAGVWRHALSYGVLAVVLTGKRYFEIQQRLVLAQQAQTESELRTLKAQIDPHFLFNNLNVLRGLIQQDPAVANEYLNRFANLYRFLIRHKDDDFVTLEEELQFVDEYIYLLRHRFGGAYAFRQERLAAPDLTGLLVVPGTLQLLVENAIKHNVGDEEQPLLITIRFTESELVVEHALRPKLTPVDSTGTGLANLRDRYRLLFGKAIIVENTGAEFRVRIPVLRQAPRPAALSTTPRAHPQPQPATLLPARR